MSERKNVRKKERRRSTRADARLSMRVEGTPDDGETAHIVTESQNISANGVYCISPHYLAPLSKVALTIVLPDLPGARGRMLKCEGIVVRCLTADTPMRSRRYQLACSFLGLEDRHRQQLEAFISWRNLQALSGAIAAPRSARRSGKAAARSGSARSTNARRTRPGATSRTSRTGTAARTRSRRTIH